MISRYRPISQLPHTAKILEGHVTMPMRRYIDENGINDMFQSAYCPNHSTKTVLVIILKDMYLLLGRRKIVVLYLLI